VKDYHVIMVKDDELKIAGYDEVEANDMARNIALDNEGCSAVVVRYVRVYSVEPRIMVEDIESGCKYSE
jgi:hypothetical protein